MIDIQHVHKSFGKLQVLRNIDLEIFDSGIYAILGPNGSGKTTLLKSMLGMVLPEQGTIRIQGKDVRRNWKYRDQISYLPQIARFPENLSLKELIDLLKRIRPGATRDTDLIEYFSLEKELGKKLGKLSGGNRQKANIVLSFMYECPLIIMDEPTAGLDPLSRIRLKEWINREKERGAIILFTTHIMELVDEVADRIIYLLDGEIYFNGTVNELNERYFGENVERSIAHILSQKKPEYAFSV